MKILFYFIVGFSMAQGILHETTFFLYGSSDGEPEEMKASQSDSITNATFNVCYKTLFLITGHRRSIPDPEIVEAARIIAKKSFNAIVVNYDTRFYILSVPIAGNAIAKFVRTLNSTLGYDQKYMIFMGFSLGAHVAGMAGSLSQVGRIIGIDPSGPYYDFFPSFVRLDRSDSAFVDTLHSSRNLGTRLPRVGHVRFILDGGTNQPGCELRNCSHLRAGNFTKSSITRCVFTFRRCFSYAAFRMGLCKNYPTLNFGLGLDIGDVKTRYGEKYYHDITQQDYPYCKPEEETDPSFSGNLCSERGIS